MLLVDCGKSKYTIIISEKASEARVFAAIGY